MKLWTWQTPDFLLTSGRVDLTRSFYYQIYPAFPAAYAELARRVGTDQIIWCFVRREDCDKRGWPDRVEWSLDVPDDNILCLTDTFIWNKIIGHKTYPESLRKELWANAPPNIPSIGDYVDQKIDEYHAQPSPAGGWWPQLFITDMNAEGATALLKHPISESWVLRDGRDSLGS